MTYAEPCGALVGQELRGRQRRGPDRLLRHVEPARQQPGPQVARGEDRVVGQHEELASPLLQPGQELGRARGSRSPRGRARRPCRSASDSTGRSASVAHAPMLAVRRPRGDARVGRAGPRGRIVRTPSSALQEVPDAHRHTRGLRRDARPGPRRRLRLPGDQRLLQPDADRGRIQGFAEAESDGIVQVSTGGAEYLSGSTVKDMVTGSLALAAYAHEVAKKYPVNIALHTDHCPKDKLDGFVRPLLAASDRAGQGRRPADLPEPHVGRLGGAAGGEPADRLRAARPGPRGERRAGDRGRRRRRRGGRRRGEDGREALHDARATRSRRSRPSGSASAGAT